MKEAVLCLLLLVPVHVFADDWEEQRAMLVDEVAQQIREILGRDLSARVEAAMRKVERHRYVPVDVQHRAYLNVPLPIGDEQTISQPLIVALMTELLEPDPADRILEIGTGSGYQAAVLAELVDHVDSIEIIGSLAQRAAATLRRNGVSNVTVHHGDGMKGLESEAPFDGIIVTAAGLDIPETLLDQLAPGGRLVMPVGPVYAVQQLKLVEKAPGSYIESNVLPVRFVPITKEVR